MSKILKLCEVKTKSNLFYIYVKPVNEIFARHLLRNCRQKHDELIYQFLQAVSALSKDCSYNPVTAESYREEAIRDAFINILDSNLI